MWDYIDGLVSEHVLFCWSIWSYNMEWSSKVICAGTDWSVWKRVFALEGEKESSKRIMTLLSIPIIYFAFGCSIWSWKRKYWSQPIVLG